MKKYLFLIAVTFLGNYHAQKNSKKLLINGYLHVGTGQVIEKSAIGIEADKIILVRDILSYTYKTADWDTIIDLKGQHVYPGFIAPNATLGLTEIDAVRATRDFSEVGIFNPHVRALIAYNVESKVIGTVRTNGVLLTQATPRSGFITGSSSIMHLSGWNWEDAVAKKDDGIHVNWPESMQGGGWWAEPAEKKRNENYDVQRSELIQFFKQSLAYSQSKTTELDIRYEAMKGIFNGTKRVYFHANDIQQLLDILDFVHQFELKYPVIVGGQDAHLITRQLKDASIPVMLPRLHSIPALEEDAIDLPYRLPYLLQSGGVKFCLQNEGDMEAMNARNLPFLAGTAMAYGLTEEQAVRSISLSAAEIVGIDAQFGSIEVGKIATFFVSSGNALDMKTNNISRILIKGEFISTANSQTELYHKYKQKLSNK